MRRALLPPLTAPWSRIQGCPLQTAPDGAVSLHAPSKCCIMLSNIFSSSAMQLRGISRVAAATLSASIPSDLLTLVPHLGCTTAAGCRAAHGSDSYSKRGSLMLSREACVGRAMLLGATCYCSSSSTIRTCRMGAVSAPTPNPSCTVCQVHTDIHAKATP